MKKSILKSVFLVVAMGLLSCSGEDMPKQEPEVLILEDLSVLFNQDNNSAASKGDCGFGLSGVNGFPVNGCGTFTVKQTINYVFGETTVETKVTVCCACAVCFIKRLGKEGVWEGLQKDKVKGIRVLESSSITFRNYEISIAEGDYEVNENGNIKRMKYKVIVN